MHNKAAKWLLLFSALAGAALAMAFQPVGWWPLAFPALAFLFHQWQFASPGICFKTGLAFGLGLYLTGVSWVYVSLHTYGGMPLWMGSIAVLGFAALLALFIALAGYLSAKLLPSGGMYRLSVLPLLWVLFEWTKSWILTGFPWLELGYTQTSSWLFALAPVGGVYLISVTVAILATLLVAMLTQPKCRVSCLVVLAGVLVVTGSLQNINWSEDSGAVIDVGVVQANVAIEDKWRIGNRDRLINQLASLSAQLNQSESLDLLVWPETALPLYLQQTDDAFWRSIVPHDTALLTGLLDSQAVEQTYNAAALVCDGERQIYRKHHLVPFGEYLPLRFLFDWVLDYLQLPMSDLSAWQGEQSLSCANGLKIGMSICYEDAFGSEFRQTVGDATMLVNISEDGWFGDSFAPHQRSQMAQMRARELARPMVRSANTGPSTVIDHWGQVLAKTAQFEVATLAVKIQPQAGDTPYKRFGNWIVWIAVVGLFVIAVLQRRQTQ